jgi:soluble lytic murein transglycosylase-like protein
VQGSIDYWARVYHVDVHLARAVAWMESGNDPNAVSPTGARGVMQVEPSTWRYTEHLLNTHVSHTTDGNIRIGIAYLHQMLLEFAGNRRLALAAYYEGPRAVREVGLYASSEHYVATVMALVRTM